LERALHTAKNAATYKSVGAPRLCVFLAVDCDNTDTSAENPAIHRDGDWLFKHIIDPLNKSGVKYSVDISWSSDWYGSIVSESKKHNPELIMLPLVKRPSEHGRIFNESIWRLLRTALCPVLVVQPHSPGERKVILAAVNFQSHKPEYRRLNDLIIDRGQWLATIHNAELHIVNAYKDSLNYPDRSQLATATAVNTANIHVRAGEPGDVIAGVARELGADIVVLGIRARASRWRGNTSEKIITKISCDLLTIH
jgi:universal stress protein E